MKRTILVLLFVANVLPSHAEDSTYRVALSSAHERYNILEADLHDYRKVIPQNPKPELPKAQDEERLRLLGRLMSADPVWALSQQLQADISAIAAMRSRTPADDAILDSLKDLLAITSRFEDRASTLAEAEQMATALRQYVARRDATGASAWARSR